MSVDLPTFGKPSRPASASTRSSRRSSRCSPGVPGSACRGARFVGVAKWMVAAPAASAARDHGALAGGAQVGEQLARLGVVDERARRHAQDEVGAARARTGPCRARARRARRAASAGRRGRAASRGRGRRASTTSPPSPPSPPLGPPRGTYFSRRKATQPVARRRRPRPGCAPRRRTSWTPGIVAEAVAGLHVRYTARRTVAVP